MSSQIETVTESPADVVRGLYDALSKGDVPGVLARLDPEVIVDEPNQLPYGGVHQGREAFVRSVLGAMMGYANITITDAEVFEGPAGVIGTLTGTLTAHATGEEFPLTMVEIHQVEDGTVRKVDVYTKNPHELAAFYARRDRHPLTATRLRVRPSCLTAARAARPTHALGLGPGRRIDGPCRRQRCRGRPLGLRAWLQADSKSEPRA